MNFSPILLVNSIFFVWFLILTFIVLRTHFSFGRIAKNGKNESFLKTIDELLKKQEDHKKMLSQLEKRCDTLEKEGDLHIQKVGLVRFNPFKDTGGDQSFILALVDAKETGIVISSLHTRTGTRWYAKKVVNGKGLEYELSDEERKALSGAKTVEDQK